MNILNCACIQVHTCIHDVDAIQWCCTFEVSRSKNISIMSIMSYELSDLDMIFCSGNRVTLLSRYIWTVHTMLYLNSTL